MKWKNALAWTIEFDSAVEKDLKKIGKDAAKKVINYLKHRIATLDEPRELEKALTGDK